MPMDMEYGDGEQPPGEAGPIPPITKEQMEMLLEDRKCGAWNIDHQFQCVLKLDHSGQHDYGKPDPNIPTFLEGVHTPRGPVPVELRATEDPECEYVINGFFEYRAYGKMDKVREAVEHMQERLRVIYGNSITLEVQGMGQVDNETKQ